MAGAAERLAGEEARAIDGEEHPARAAGPHRLDVDALRKNGHLPAADERDVAALIEHGLAHGEQHHHHAHAEREAEEQEEGAELPDPEMAEGEGEEHQSQIVAVEHVDHPAGLRGEAVVVRHDDERGAVVVEPAEQIEDLAPVAASSSPVGSSASSSAGWLASARAMATRCISPPESCVARWPPRAASPT